MLRKNLLLVSLLALPLSADILPTSPGVVHLDPFVPGPIALGLFGLAACGTPGELVAPGLGIPWSAATCPTPGVDGFVGGLWIWQSEIDLDPLGGLPPVVLVSLFGAAPVPVATGPGSEIFISIFQFDANVLAPPPPGGFCPAPAGLEVGGSVCKQLLNLTPGIVGWGTSVTEVPAGGAELPHKEVTLKGLTELFQFTPPSTFHNLLSISGDAQIGYAIEELNVPEPATLALVGIGIGWMMRRRRG